MRIHYLVSDFIVHDPFSDDLDRKSWINVSSPVLDFPDSFLQTIYAYV
ncbi:hypothetical protein [Leptospira kirschneri]|nr:hypothetical protein [Leptospira kirschneri]